VEQSDTHLPIREQLYVLHAKAQSFHKAGSVRFDQMGIAALHPSYGAMGGIQKNSQLPSLSKPMIARE
jgi:hypothetical protein